MADHPDLAGIVIGHGTATLEETAWVLNLVLKVAVPVVLIGSQRPASGLSTDAAINLLNGVRTAASPDSRGRGVLVLLNDEIQAAREVTKTSNWRMQTFRTPDFGILGHADADRIAYYRRPERRHMPDTEFDIAGLDALPRVDIAYAYAGSDGSAMRAFIAAGARGLVSAGFAPGMPPAADLAAMTEAVRQGIVVVQSSRAGSGRIHRSKQARRRGRPGSRQSQPAEGAAAAGAGPDPDLRPGRDRAHLRDLLSRRGAQKETAGLPRPFLEVLVRGSSYWMTISTRRFCGSRTLSPVGTSSWLSPLPMTVIAWAGTPSRTRASLTALARRSDSAML